MVMISSCDLLRFNGVLLFVCTFRLFVVPSAKVKLSDFLV